MAENATEKLKKLTEEYEAFAYIVSHDLKAPARAITNLTGWIEEDLDGNFPGDTEENFRLLKNRSQRLSSMIDALLEFSRATRTNLETGEMALKTRIEEIAQNLMREKAVKFSVSGDNLVLKTLEKKLTYVLTQLLHNAVYFNDKQSPEIAVTISSQRPNVVIQITDNGPGIPDSALTNVFTIFYTVQNKDQANSTGAGLAIANKIVNFVNGELTLANRPGGGLEVTLIWPETLPATLTEQ